MCAVAASRSFGRTVAWAAPSNLPRRNVKQQRQNFPMTHCLEQIAVLFNRTAHVAAATGTMQLTACASRYIGKNGTPNREGKLQASAFQMQPQPNNIVTHQFLNAIVPGANPRMVV